MMRAAIYGKGGIGKSTTTSNIAVALSRMGYRVMQIGCDPKADSTRMLTGGKPIPTVLELLRGKKHGLELEDIVHTGYNGILCVEAGGPLPGIGCAGRGIITALDVLVKMGAYEFYQPDIVLYDVLGDVVCGGFAMPLRGEYTDAVFIVTSGEMMAMYAASNIVQALANFRTRDYARYGGLILNRRNVEREVELVQMLAQETEGNIIGIVPRSEQIQQGEGQGKTAMELFPASELAECYRNLALQIVEVCKHERKG